MKSTLQVHCPRYLDFRMHGLVHRLGQPPGVRRGGSGSPRSLLSGTAHGVVVALSNGHARRSRREGKHGALGFRRTQSIRRRNLIRRAHRGYPFPSPLGDVQPRLASRRWGREGRSAPPQADLGRVAFAKSTAMVRLKDRLVSDFGHLPIVAEAIARVVVDPASVRAQLGSPNRERVPGGTLLTINTTVWPPAVCPSPANPRPSRAWCRTPARTGEGDKGGTPATHLGRGGERREPGS